MTGVQRGKRHVRHRPGSISGECGRLQRNFRRRTRFIMREVTRGNIDAADMLVNKPISVEYYVW